MKTRASHKWKQKTGTWDACNTELIDFEGDYPLLNGKPVYGRRMLLSNDFGRLRQLQPNIISMFVDDYALEKFWNTPLRYVERLASFGAEAVMSPDFSIYVDMPLAMQAWQVYRNRLVGWVWQQCGINVIPTIQWGDHRCLPFCFEGVAKNSAVAVSNIGCSTEHQKKFFDGFLSIMMNHLQPSQVVFHCRKPDIEYFRERGERENIPFHFVRSYWEEVRDAKRAERRALREMAGGVDVRERRKQPEPARASGWYQTSIFD